MNLLKLNLGDHFRFSQNEADPIYEVIDIVRKGKGKWQVQYCDIDTPNKYQYGTGAEEVYEVIPSVYDNELDLIDYKEEDEL
jgi:hypothetical protein